MTGNNITNINTEGYTRQRLNQVSLIPSVNDRYYSSYNTRIGQGAVVAGITQVRDPGLDISYRKANSDVGSANAKLEGLNQLATILDEVGKGSLEQDDGVILSQLNDIRDLISQAITSGGSSTYDSLIRSSADALCKFFNSYADKLSELKNTYENNLNQEVTEVNDILTQIRDLNESIRNADLRGDPALELRDNRNNLLDKLSEYMKIDVKYTMENVGADTWVEKLTVTLATGDKQTLVDGVYGTQLSLNDQLLVRNPDFPEKDTTNPYLDTNNQPVSDPTQAATVDNPNYTLVLGPLLNGNGEKKSNTDFGSELSETDMYGSLQSIRDILNGKGEYATTPESLEAALDSNIKQVNDLLDKIKLENAKIYAVGSDQATIDEAKAEREQLVKELENYVAIDCTDTGRSFTIQLKNGGSTILDNGNTVIPFNKEKDAVTGQYSVSVNGTPANPGGGLLGAAVDAANSPADTTLDSSAATKRGIPYYQMALDNLAYQFATEMNKLNNTGLDGSGNLFSMGSDTDAAMGVDPVTGDPLRITASNITVSKGWDNQAVSIQYTADPNAPSGDTSLMAKFLDLFSKKMNFEPGDINTGAGGSPYHGSFEDMLLKIQSTLAEDQMSTDAVLNNYVVTADNVYTDREGVTGVDLNDEATGLMTYQKAYTAACRLMNVLNEALDSLINGTV